MSLHSRCNRGMATLLTTGLAIMGGGCGGGSDSEAAPVIAKSQQSASEAWNTAKTNGTDKNTSKAVKKASAGNQGHTLGPGGATN